MKNLLIILVLFAFACSSTHQFNLQGKIDDMGNDKVVLQLRGKSLSDTVKVNNGIFEISLDSIDSDYYRLKFIENNLYLPAMLANGNIEIRASLIENRYRHIKKVHIKGSSSINNIIEFDDSFGDFLKQLDTEAYKTYLKYYLRSENKLSIAEMHKQMGALMKKYPTMPKDLNLFRHKMLLKLTDDIALAEILKSHKMNMTFEQQIELVDALSPRMKANPHMKKFIKNVEDSKLTREGNTAPNFKLKNINGENFELNSLRGNYVLLDFWASWCGPCRKSFPHLRQLMEKYKGKNFKIVGISIDKNKDKWIKASKEEKINWINLLTNDGTKTKKVDELYAIQAVPTVILISPEGKVIKKTNSPHALDAILDKLIK